MDKRELAKIPLMDAPADLVERALNPEEFKHLRRYMATAAVDQDKKILLLYFFDKNGLKERNTKAVYRLFLSKEEYITQNLRVSKVRWLTGKIERILGGYWHICNAVEMVSDQDKKIVQKFFHSSDDAVSIIQRVEDQIADKKREQNLMKERQQIDIQMQTFQRLPDDFDDFMREEVMYKHYLFYNRKEDYCYCTKCRREYSIKRNERILYSGFDLQKLKHNEKNQCRLCGEMVTCKSLGYGRGLLLENRWAVLVQRCGEDVHTRVFSAYWNLTKDYKNTEIIYEELYRSVFKETTHQYYEMTRFHGKYEERWCRIKDNQMLHHQPRSVVIYGHNIPDAFQGTPYQYCMLQEYVYARYRRELFDGFEFNDSFLVDNYLELYQRRPWIESLIKLGCKKLVNSIEGISADCSKKNLPEILELNKQHFQILMNLTGSDPDSSQLRIMQKIYEKIKLQNREEITAVFEVCDNAYDVERIRNLIQYVSVRKLLNYLEVQKRENSHMRLSDLEDHCEMLQELNYNIRENLLPRDFFKEHRRVSRELNDLKDQQLRIEEQKESELIARRMKEMQEVLEIRMNGLCVLAPAETIDLKREGRELHHCVGTYVQRVAEAKTNIFFIRKTEYPKVPYFTIEINMEGDMKQCRGKNNCSMPDDVKEFAEAFTERVKQYFAEQTKIRTMMKKAS